jgi:two-component system sensor histidine kinase KdpD
MQTNSGKKNDAQSIESINDILSAAKNAEGIITSILLLSQARQAPPKLQPCNIYESLESALLSLQHRLQEKQITVNVVKNQALSAVAHNPWLERIWVNLLDNAIKYGGPEPLITAGARLEGERILCWVADNGPGIPPESRALVFQDFHQNIDGDSSGFGLGLSMIAQLLKHMNGTIDIEDCPGAKLVFVLKAHAVIGQTERVAAPLDCG